MLGYETQFWIMWAALVQAAGVLTQCVLIYMGFNTMRQANELRSRQLEAQEKARDAQHEENMAALNELIRQGREFSKQSENRHEENMAALKTLIERTAPNA